jgi:hypothetical protein
MANLVYRFLDGKISLQDYSIEGKSITQSELLKLQELYKSDFAMIDRTRHYKKQFIGLKHFRIHVPTWLHNVIRLLNPLSLVPFFVYQRKWLFLGIYFLMVIYILQGVLGLVPLVLSLFLSNREGPQFFYWFGVIPNSMEYWTPVIIYCLLCFIYATQMSTWTEGVAEAKRLAKLESLQLLVSLPHRKSDTFLVTAKDVARSLVNFIETDSSKTKFRRLRSHGVSFLSMALALIYLFLPFLNKNKMSSESDIPSDRISVHTDYVFIYFGKHFFTAFNVFLRYLFDFLFLSGLFSELFISLDYLWKRVRLLRLYTNVTSEKAAARRELYHFKLNTPENIICWAKIRKYLQAHNSDRFVFFQVLLAILSIVVISLLILLLVRLRHAELTLLDYKVLYLITVFGLYLIVILWIGGLIDFAQKQHVTILRKQKWKLQRHIIQYHDSDGDVRKRLDFSQPEDTLKNYTSKTNENIRVDSEPLSSGSSNDEIVFSDEETERNNETLSTARHQLLSKARSRLSFGMKSTGKRRRTRSSKKDPSTSGNEEQQNEYDYSSLEQDMNISFFEQQKHNRSKRTSSSSSPHTPTKTFSVSPQSVLSPTALSSPKEGKEKEIVEQCQTLLSKLVEVLQQTDRPLQILMLRVDYSLAVKVTSVLFSAIISRILRSALA